MTFSVISLIISVTAVMIALIGVRNARNSGHANLLRDAFRDMYSPEFRADRAQLYSLSLKEYAEWTEEEFETANRVAILFDRFGFLIHLKYLPQNYLEFWGEIIVRCYKLCEPMIADRRVTERMPHHFVNFEWLARTAITKKSGTPWWRSASWERTKIRTNEELSQVSIPPRFHGPGSIKSIDFETINSESTELPGTRNDISQQMRTRPL